MEEVTMIIQTRPDVILSRLLESLLAHFANAFPELVKDKINVIASHAEYSENASCIVQEYMKDLEIYSKVLPVLISNHLQHSESDRMKMIQFFYTIFNPYKQLLETFSQMDLDESTVSFYKTSLLMFVDGLATIARDTITKSLNINDLTFIQECGHILNVFLTLSGHFGGDDVFIQKPDPTLYATLMGTDTDPKGYKMGENKGN